MSTVERPESLSDDQLLSRVEELARRSRRAEAELIWHLAEVDRRRLYRREACSSMHVYATARLHLSEAEAFLRIAVARASRRFPVVLRMLADGRLHLTAIAKLAPHLTPENCDALLAQAVHRSKRDIEKLVARIARRPDVPSGMRRLPGARPAELCPGGVDNRMVAPTEPLTIETDRSAELPSCAGAPPRPPAQAVLVALSEERYKVQFTVGEELHGKILRAQALLRHQIPDGNLAAVFDRAMSLLLRELERVRFAATQAPRKAVEETDPRPSSRRIPAAIKREVWIRDGEQCTFRDQHGRRCSARDRLEFHHLTPFAHGGEHAESNITLRCSTHNAYQADLDFGAEFMAEQRKRGRGRGSSRCGEPPPPGFGLGAAESSAAPELGRGAARSGSSASPRCSVLGPRLMDNARAATWRALARYPQPPPAPQRSRVGFNTHQQTE